MQMICICNYLEGNEVLTKWRKLVFDVINSSEKPLNAEDIYRLNNFKPNLSTVYRALNYLEKKSYISSVSFDGGTKYYFSKDKHFHFLYCTNCGKIEVFEECMASELEKKIKSKFGYLITDHVFYFKGLCKKCRKEVKGHEK